MKKILMIAAAALFLASCAPKYTATAPKPDADLSCGEITTEITRAKSASDDASKNRGLSAQNVAWAIFFLPGVLANEYTNDQVQQKAAERIATLNNLYTAKKCTK
jgi:PBP1b-binding outer membrane lipoprotein LpoB